MHMKNNIAFIHVGANDGVTRASIDQLIQQGWEGVLLDTTTRVSLSDIVAKHDIDGLRLLSVNTEEHDDETIVSLDFSKFENGNIVSEDVI